MVIRIVKNITSNPIYLADLDCTIPVGGQLDLGATRGLGELAESNSLAISLGNGSLILNIGDDIDIPFPYSIDIIRNIPQAFKTTADRRLIVNATPQPGTMTDFCLTGRTDGAGETGDLMHIDHKVFQFGQEIQSISAPCGLFVDNGNTGNELSQYWLNTKYLEFNVLGNRTFFYDGGIKWEGLSANGSNGLMSITLQAVNSVWDPTDYETVPGVGNAVIIDNYLMLPYPGGNYNLPVGRSEIETPQPFKMTAVSPMVNTGKYWSPAFWQIDYNLITKVFFNLQPCGNPYAETRSTSVSPGIVRIYGNIFTAEIPLMSFVKDFIVIGSADNFFSIASPDATEIGYGIRIRMDCKTIVNSVHLNTPWAMVGFMKTYREKTV